MIILIYLFIFGLGAIIGSFLNVVILRLKKGEDFVNGRSHCTKCSHVLKWYENIPLLSFLILRGKCLKCKKKISWQYPIIEFVTGSLFLLSFLKIFNNFVCLECIDTTLFLVFSWVVISFLILIFVYDIKYYLIPDKISMPAVIIVFIWQIVLSVLKNGKFIFEDVWLLLLSGIIIGGFFALQFIISKGKWIGGGDIRLGFLMGVILGWPYGLVALFLAYILGLIYAVPVISFGKKKMKSQIPFGTFLTVATLIVLFYGKEILDWYLGLVI